MVEVLTALHGLLVQYCFFLSEDLYGLG